MRFVLTTGLVALVSVAHAEPPQNPLAERLEQLEERLRQLEDAALDESAVDEERAYDVYGFFDLYFAYVDAPDMRGREVFWDQPGFVFGHLNLYHDFRPGPGWRVLAEIGFTMAPMGGVETYENSALGTTFERTNVAAWDWSSFGSTFDWGGILIERAWAEWSGFEPLQVRVGIFLTPFGIWNVDHGAPARTTTQPPLMYSSEFGAFPKRQLGLQLRGRVRAGEATLEYALTVSNGEGPTATWFDLDANKAIGGRFVASGDGDVRWRAGASFYWGRYTDTATKIELPHFDLESRVVVQHDDTSFGADASVEYAGFTTELEFVGSWRAHAVGKRAPMFGDPTRVRPDRLALGVHALFSYRLPTDALSLTPFVTASWADWNDTDDKDDTIGVSVGARWAPISAVAVKVEYQRWIWPNRDVDPIVFRGTPPWNLLMTELSVAF